MEPTRTMEKRKAKEVLAENSTRGSLGCWEDMGRNEFSTNRVRWRHSVNALCSSES
jgi:hypothetical protein